MWYEMRSQTQHRVYRREAGKKKYEAFATEAEARAFLKHCRTHDVSVVLAAMASSREAVPASTPAPTAPTEVPRLAGSLRAPELTGITLKWLATHYVTNTTEANEVTKDGYLRDIERVILPYFGDIDIALVQTHSLPLADDGEWPFPTVVAWKQELAGMPKANDPGATIADKTRRNIEALLAQIFSSAVDFALTNGISAYVGIAELGWFRKIQTFGWDCRMLGAPQGAGETALVALRIDIDQQTLARLAAAGIRSVATPAAAAA